MTLRRPDYHPIKTVNNRENRKASTHLTFLDTLVDRMKDIQQFVADMLGARNGVWADTTSGTSALLVEAQGTPSMKVDITAGWIAVDGVPKYISSYTSGDFTAPSGNPRIDTIAASADSGDIVIHTGTEASSPTAPSVDSDETKLAEIYHRVGETSIKDTDDASNGYITDSRTKVNF